VLRLYGRAVAQARTRTHLHSDPKRTSRLRAHSGKSVSAQWTYPPCPPLLIASPHRPHPTRTPTPSSLPSLKIVGPLSLQPQSGCFRRLRFHQTRYITPIDRGPTSALLAEQSMSSELSLRMQEQTTSSGNGNGTGRRDRQAGYSARRGLW